MDAADWLRALLALVFTLSLIALAAWAVRRFAGTALGVTPSGNTARLAVLERRMIDPRHQLVLVRRENREHLLVLSTQGPPLLIESLESKP